jgi:hypothetical protein
VCGNVQLISERTVHQLSDQEDAADMAKQIMIVDDDQHIVQFMYLALAFEGLLTVTLLDDLS